MDNLSDLTEADLCDMLADLQMDFGTERNDLIDLWAWVILEELRPAGT